MFGRTMDTVVRGSLVTLSTMDTVVRGSLVTLSTMDTIVRGSHGYSLYTWPDFFLTVLWDELTGPMIPSFLVLDVLKIQEILFAKI